MGIDEQGQVIEDDPKLGEHPLGQCKRPFLIPLNDDLEIPTAPDQESYASDQDEASNEDEKGLLPFWTQIHILNEIELVERNKERKDGGIFLGKDSKQVAEESSPQVKESDLSMGQSPFDVQDEGEEVKHPRHAGHSLYDVGHRLGLDRMGNEDQTGKERYLVRDGSIFLPERGKTEGQDEKPIQGNPRKDVDQKIYQMVAKDIELSEIVIEGEGEIGKETNTLFISILH
jgi:hypothetical protein